MTDYAAQSPSEAGATVTQRAGTASADTVPAPCTLLVINTNGAAPHNVDLAIGATWRGLYPGSTGAPGKRRIVVGTSGTAAAVVAVKVPGDMGDANGRVAVTIDGTAGEIGYYVLPGA